MNLKQMWASIIAWWSRFAARWRKPAQPIPVMPEVVEIIPEVPAIELEEFEVVPYEAYAHPSLPIELIFIKPPVVETETKSGLQQQVEMLIGLLAARELRAHRHYQSTGSCNIDIPRIDSRVSKPIDSRTHKTRNSRSPR
jgi:hypothetical protein